MQNAKQDWTFWNGKFLGFIKILSIGEARFILREYVKSQQNSFPMTIHEMRTVCGVLWVQQGLLGYFCFGDVYSPRYMTHSETDIKALYNWKKFNSSVVTELVTISEGSSRPGHTWINAMSNVLRNFGHMGRFKGVWNKPLSFWQTNQRIALKLLTVIGGVGHLNINLTFIIIIISPSSS